MAQRYWLMKSEPDAFSIDDLAARPGGREPWDGIRNYQARNLIRDEMKEGDKALFYHSSCPVPGVVGLAEIVGEARPDPLAWDPESDYFDPKSSPDNPRWLMIDVRFVEKFDHFVPLADLKAEPKLAGMRVIQRGQRLSIQPVERDHFQLVCQMAGAQTKIA